MEDAGNIVYIIIAIALAILNAVAQNKKKKKAARPIVTSFEEDEHEQLYDYETSKPVEKSFKGAEQNPFEVIFGVQPINEVIDTIPVQEEILTHEDEGKSAFEEPQMTDYQRRLLERSKDFEHIDNSPTFFNFEENSIASSAIGDALTEEEEALAVESNRSELLKEFDVRKAVLYSEIIKPKYFSIGVNS